MAIEVITLKNGTKRYKARIWDPALNKRRSKTFKRRKDAEQAEADMKIRLYLGEPLERRKDIMFDEFATDILENCTASESTLTGYRHINRLLIGLLGKKSVRSIGVRDVEKAVAEMCRRYAPNTVNKAVIRLRHIFRRAIAYGYITVSPAEHISNKPKAVNLRKMEILEAHEIKLLLDTADPHWKPLLTLWLATGLRLSEIFGLDPSCIDIANSRVHVRQQLKAGKLVPYTKNRRPRTVDVSPQILEMVRAHMDGAVYMEGTARVVFASVTGRPVHMGDWNHRVFKPLVAAIGRPEISTHCLRHTFASQALSQGMNFKALQEALGHGDASLTLNRYSHLVPSDGRKAADRMSEFLLREECVPLHRPSLDDGDESTEAA